MRRPQMIQEQGLFYTNIILAETATQYMIIGAVRPMCRWDVTGAIDRVIRESLFSVGNVLSDAYRTLYEMV